jgi:hypothetical protein
MLLLWLALFVARLAAYCLSDVRFPTPECGAINNVTYPALSNCLMSLTLGSDLLAQQLTLNFAKTGAAFYSCRLCAMGTQSNYYCRNNLQPANDHIAAAPGGNLRMLLIEQEENDTAWGAYGQYTVEAEAGDRRNSIAVPLDALTDPRATNCGAPLALVMTLVITLDVPPARDVLALVTGEPESGVALDCASDVLLPLGLDCGLTPEVMPALFTPQNCIAYYVDGAPQVNDTKVVTLYSPLYWYTRVLAYPGVVSEQFCGTRLDALLFESNLAALCCARQGGACTQGMTLWNRLALQVVARRLSGVDPSDPLLRAALDLAERSCSARWSPPAQWPGYVDRLLKKLESTLPEATGEARATLCAPLAAYFLNLSRQANMTAMINATATFESQWYFAPFRAWVKPDANMERNVTILLVFFGALPVLFCCGVPATRRALFGKKRRVDQL